MDHAAFDRGAGSGGGLFDKVSRSTVTGGSVITGNTPDNCAGTTC